MRSKINLSPFLFYDILESLIAQAWAFENSADDKRRRAERQKKQQEEQIAQEQQRREKEEQAEWEQRERDVKEVEQQGKKKLHSGLSGRIEAKIEGDAKQIVNDHRLDEPGLEKIKPLLEFLKNKDDELRRKIKFALELFPNLKRVYESSNLDDRVEDLTKSCWHEIFRASRDILRNDCQGGKPEVKTLTQRNEGINWSPEDSLKRKDRQEWLGTGTMGGCLSAIILVGPTNENDEYKEIKGFHGGGGPTDELKAFVSKNVGPQNYLIIAYSSVGAGANLERDLIKIRSDWPKRYQAYNQTTFLFVNKKGDVLVDRYPIASKVESIADPILGAIQEKAK